MPPFATDPESARCSYLSRFTHITSLFRGFAPTPDSSTPTRSNRLKRCKPRSSLELPKQVSVQWFKHWKSFGIQTFDIV
jgi:hypothetical protein